MKCICLLQYALAFSLYCMLQITHIFPYAYVFGLSEIYADKLEKLNVEMPVWFGNAEGDYIFRAQYMKDFHQDFNTSIGIDSSSGSGGGSGSSGGFSGGGFGGGGDGSW